MNSLTGRTFTVRGGHNVPNVRETCVALKQKKKNVLDVAQLLDIAQ